MRIAHVLNRLPPPSGYHEFVLASEQAADGHEVLIVASDRGQQGWRGPAATDADYRGLPYRVVRLPAIGVHPLLFIPTLAGQLREFAPDVAHVHGVLHHWGLWTVARLKRAGHIGRIVLDSHAAPYNTKRMGGMGDLYRGIMLRAAQAGPVRDVDAVIAMSPESAAFIERHGIKPHAIVALPALVPPRTATPRFQPQRIEMFYGGKVVPGRDLDVLVRAAARAAARVGDRSLRLTLCGAGEPAFGASLARLAAGSPLELRHTGHLPAGRYYDELAASDLAVWPGQVTIAIQEAMSVGVPVVAADVADIRFLARLGAGIRLCARGDTEAFAVAMQDLATNDDERAILARQAHETASAFFTPRAHWRQFQGHYETG